MPLQGRVALITGASRGLGNEIARAFASAGADIVMAARDKASLERSANSVQLDCPNCRLIACPCDVTDDVAIAGLTARTVQEFGSLDILVNNAGLYGPKGAAEQVALDEWKRALEINLMGTLIPIRHALPIMKAKNYGKIINLSGGGATKPMPFLTSYAASKAAVVRLTESIALEVGDFNISINAVAPGALNTGMLEEILEAGPDRVGEAYYRSSLQQKQDGGASIENAAQLCVFLASSLSDGISGRLISAVWDDWGSLAARIDDLRSTDIYTLRRITAEDRGLDWGR